MHPLAQPVILVCGHGTRVDITSGESEVSHDAGFVPVDTTCLCKPLVKIDYCANIYIDNNINANNNANGYNDVELTFILKSICNGIENVLDTFVYRRELHLNDSELGTIATQDSFCFTYCDHPFPGYDTYKVVVSATVGSGVDAVSIRETQINAIAQ
jgi:hypothetical protein